MLLGCMPVARRRGAQDEECPPRGLKAASVAAARMRRGPSVSSCADRDRASDNLVQGVFDNALGSRQSQTGDEVAHHVDLHH